MEVRERTVSAHGRDISLFIVAGEHSGDALGAKLMAALNQGRRGRVRYLGVGGPQMAAQGLVSLFPLEDVAVMGPVAIAARFPQILSRVYRTVSAAAAAEPDAVIIIDSPEFTHPIAKRIRRRCPGIPIIDYVSPSVWAWRPGRARKMRDYIDHVLALWPFEPEAHKRLGGPPCSFVGHPLIERHPWIASLDPAPLAERLALAKDTPRAGRAAGQPQLGSLAHDAAVRRGARRAAARGRKFDVVMPVMSSVRPLIEQHLKAWPQQPHLVEGEDDKFRAFKLAKAALAASGTVTLELALAGTPMVVGYKVDAIIAPVLRRLIIAPSVVLPNLVLDERVFPEFHQEKCTASNFADALEPLLDDSSAAFQAAGRLGADSCRTAGRGPRPERGGGRYRSGVRGERPRLAAPRARQLGN